jgi:hypothetical protein
MGTFMAKKIKQSFLDSRIVKQKADESPLQAEENSRPGWYPEDVSNAEQSTKKTSWFKKITKQKPKNPEVSALQSGSTDILDILTPPSADLSHKDYIMIDDTFFAYLYLTGYGYSTTVGNGWLNPLVEAGEGINLVFTINRQPKEKTLSKISQSTMINRSRMRDVGDTRSDYEELDSAINAGMYLKDGMNRYSEDLYYMHTMIEVSA